MEAIIIAIATIFNFIVIKWKLERARWADALLDGFIMYSAAKIFSGTYSGTVVAMIASALGSIYLFYNPPNFEKLLAWLDEDEVDEKID